MRKPVFKYSLKNCIIRGIISACVVVILTVIPMFITKPSTEEETIILTDTFTTCSNTTTDISTTTKKLTTTTTTSSTVTNTTTCTEVTTFNTTEISGFGDLQENCVPEVVVTNTPTLTPVLETTSLCTLLPVTQSINSDVISEERESITFQATYYMDFTLPYVGASGRDLISGYSVASNYFPFGSIVYVESDYFPSGEYRVDDCGGMANNVLDFYYLNYDSGYGAGQLTPEFKKAGRVNVKVTLIS